MTADGVEDGSAADEGAREALDEFSPELVMQLYAKWCLDRVQPQSTERLEIGALTYDTSDPGSVLGGSKRHILRNSKQVAEFVRFSPADSSQGFILPNPDAHFTPNIAHVFPGLSREDLDNPASLLSRAPVPVKRRNDTQWEVQ
jgi:hypothetical protein